jgi:hypothetical protein
MSRLKKKYMEKYAQPQPVVPVPGNAKAAVQIINMTLRDTATRHGVPIKTIRTLAKKYGIAIAQMGKYGTIRISDMDALQAKLGLCDKPNADPYLRSLPLSKRWKWRPRKPTDVIARTPEQAQAEVRAVEYAIIAGIPFTARADGAFVFLDLRGLICFPSPEERPLGYAFANVPLVDRRTS